MKKVAIILADGFEEIEAITIIDILRRAGIDVSVVGLNQALVNGAHDITVKANILLDELDETSFDMIILPGGLTGTNNLANNNKVLEVLNYFNKKGKYISAICAAPMVLSKAGVLKNNFTCYPGFENEVRNFGYINDQNVVIDGNIITSKGPATAMEFSLALIKELLGENKLNEIKKEILL
ncbi:DJ-1/PfpI family protein (DUF4066 domain) [Campylobacter pinnipediorum subsp. caledonicus]|uniref:DJ-1/PfpI family protein (DUF4066 domain) n=1 Tax=Campylobacter pinnipediorum subsp. caledonicus TaxID=1874362 RepID=A0A1S6U7G4_9BACT|nr:DJ-1 family glyoxalase III [Campylobacter pinnipediorum]AQW86056.1 DJ-1/PfpI family protein (DUF4066 domain) [Campylobacter pinnipediorum subsp. caledonicus]AQW87663.1 DJ-1/PfpI family protein (DUF4066 domain) [Campylobacter pinnipediorum subsp. caledonicus]OPA72206.1 thiamine biosynthesis protein ThiJ [Campylobacter pinnipediorum subsp. caledonicus]